MLHRALSWLGLRERENSADGENGEDTDEGGFVPSRLDASVLESHGMETTEAERELESIEEKARILESDRPDEHLDQPDHEHER